MDNSAEVEMRYPPLWPAYLAAYVEKEMGTRYVSFRFATKSLQTELNSFKPHIVAIGAVSQNFGRALRCARICKSVGVDVVVGGPHISALPECLSEDMDVGCIGEGEQTFLELLQLFKTRAGFIPQDLRGIKGIVYRKDGKVVINSHRQPIERLDDVPHPNRSLVGYQRHAYMFTSRGCPYNCIFCSSSRFWGRVRFASPEYVVEEISELVDHGARMISFYDDLFVASKSRIRKIADLVMSRGLHKHTKFTCSCRANVVTRDLVECLKHMNVVSVGMGLESGSYRILSYLKSHVTVREGESAIKLFKDAGIQVNASFVIGSPHETEKEILETYNFIKRNPLDFVDTYLLTPLPGTPLWNFAADHGLVSPEMDWSCLNVNFEKNKKRAVILSQTLGRSDIIRLYNKFRRQRFYRIAKALPGSAWMSDLPNVGANILLKQFRNLKNKIFGDHYGGVA